MYVRTCGGHHLLQLVLLVQCSIVNVYSLTCLTRLSSEAKGAVTYAEDASTTILTLWGACRRGKADSILVIDNSNLMLSNDKEDVQSVNS